MQGNADSLACLVLMGPFVGDFYRAIKWQIALIQSHTFSKAACGNTDFAVHSLDKSFPVAPAWVHPQDLSACTFVKYGIQIAISLTHPHGAWVVLSLEGVARRVSRRH